MAEVSDSNLIAFFQRHLVPIFFTFDNGLKSYSVVVTTFAMSVVDQWFLATAGHCIRDIEIVLKEQGFRITTCNLLDSMGLGATHKDPIPFVYENAHPTYVLDDQGLDYGIIPLSALYRSLLEKNNVKPLNEDVWKKQPSKVDFYMLLGFPFDFVVHTLNSVEIATTLHRVEPVDDRPAGFNEASIPLFYGRIKLPEGMTHLQGLSGGPVFAFRMYEDGQMRYWLTALQSRGLPESHYIAACPTFFLGKALEAILAGDNSI